MSENKCNNCIHGKVCLLRRSIAEANQKCNYIIFSNDLAKICSEYKEKEELKDE